MRRWKGWRQRENSLQIQEKQGEQTNIPKVS